MCQAMSVSAGKSAVLAGIVLLLASALSGCAQQLPDEPNAAWSLLDPAAVDAGSTSLELAVMPLGCASGDTGEVSATHVELDNERVAIGLVVEPVDSGAQSCPDNATVPYTLELGQPVGQRVLVDASCRQDGEPEETLQAGSCGDGGIRWSPPPRD